MSKLIVTVGLPGSGKSYVAKEYFSFAMHISSDNIREEIYGDANCQDDPVTVFRIMFERTIAALREGKDVVYDATNLVSSRRKALVSAVKMSVPEVECVCLIITTTITECKRRQELRERKVPDEVIERMARQFQVPYFHEGWDSIYLHSNGPKQNIAREHERLMTTAHDNPHHTTGSIESHCVRALSAMTDLSTVYAELGRGMLNEVPEVWRMLKEAVYHHDIGKRKAKVFHDAKGIQSEIAHYYNHENIGAYLWLSGDMQEQGEWDDWSFLTIALLIQLHMMPYAFPNKSEEELIKWCNNKGYDAFVATLVWLIHEADLSAH